MSTIEPTPEAAAKEAPTKSSAGGDTARGATQLIVELGPVLVFMVSYNVIRGFAAEHPLFAWATATFGIPLGPKEAILFATAIFMAATLAAILFTFVRTKKVPPVLVVMGVLVAAFGGLTLALRDPTFIKLKPTIVNLFYAAAIFISLAIKQNVWKLLFKHAFDLPDAIWARLAINWGLFFIVMAIINEIVWRNFDEAFWVNFRFWGTFPLVFLFMLANLPMTMKWIGRSNEDFIAGRPNAKEA
jgi:intracellular septation protein